MFPLQFRVLKIGWNQTVWVVSIWTAAGLALLLNCIASSPTRVFVQHSVMNFPVPLYCLSLLQQQEPMQKNRARICRITMVMKTKVFSTVNRDGAWRLSCPLLLMSVSDHLQFVFNGFFYICLDFFLKNQSSITFLCLVIKCHHHCIRVRVRVRVRVCVSSF